MRKRPIFPGSAIIALSLLIAVTPCVPSPAPPQKPKMRIHENLENLVIAVAPMKDRRFLSNRGTKIRDKIAVHMEKELGFKVIKLPKPVLMGSSGELDFKTASENVENILMSTGADLLIWGGETEGDARNTWNLFVSASAHARCLAREEGFTAHEISSLDQISESSILDVLGWVTGSWYGLIRKSQGMYIPKSIKPMILKSNTVLGMVAGKGMGQGAIDVVKRNLAILLCEYGDEMKDVQALQNAVRLCKDVIAHGYVDPETKTPIGDMESQNILGQCLFDLGVMQADVQQLKGSAAAYRKALKRADRKNDSANWATLQIGLGQALAELGKRQADMSKVREAVGAFQRAEKATFKASQPHQWFCVQTGLGASYLFLGARETDTGNLRKALGYFLSLSTKDLAVLAPADAATAETNIGVVYQALAERESSPENMRRAILHTNKAMDLYRQMGDVYSEGFTLNLLGMAQVRLAHYIEDDPLIGQSRRNLERSEQLVPRAQDLELWTKSQLYIAIGQEMEGLKKMDRSLLQKASENLGQLKSIYRAKNQKNVSDEMALFQAGAELALSLFDCDTAREDRVIKTLQGILEGLDPRESGLFTVQVGEFLGRSLAKKGDKKEDPELLNQAVSVLQEAGRLADSGDLPRIKCSCENALLSAYVLYLTLKPDAAIAAQAATVLGNYEDHCLAWSIPSDKADILLCAARMERVLADIEKDKDLLIKARKNALRAFEIFDQYHYGFFAAAAKAELGEVDLLAGKMSKDKQALRRAVEELTNARDVIKSYRVCLDDKMDGKIRIAERLLVGD